MVTLAANAYVTATSEGGDSKNVFIDEHNCALRNWDSTDDVVSFYFKAEKSGKILKLGKRVFEKVCQFIREERIEQYGLQYIEVNLSAVQCSDVTLADTYISIMEKYGVPARCINLEITESASIEGKNICHWHQR